MKIVSARTVPSKPAGAPRVIDPVYATLEVPIYYVADGTLEPSGPIFCARVYADLVLAWMEKWTQKNGYQGITHLGFYNPRLARKADGSIIIPRRWSVHACGLGGDIVGILDSEGKKLKLTRMKKTAPAHLDELLAGVRIRIMGAGRKPEVVEEPYGWHLGLYP